MTSTPEIWPAFLKTSVMLFFVIAFMVLVFYFIKRFSAARGIKGSDSFIRTLCVHYLSPKEKLVLLDVLGEKILIGVTAQNITQIATINKKFEFDKEIDDDEDNETASGFSGFLAKAVKFSSARKKQEKFSSFSHPDSKIVNRSGIKFENKHNVYGKSAAAGAAAGTADVSDVSDVSDDADGDNNNEI